MIKTKLLLVALVVALMLAAACSTPSAPGAWVALDLDSGDAFFNANFVNENVGWLNGITDRSYIPPAGNNNANKAPKPKPSAKRPEDKFKANQGFEVLQTTDGGKTWKQLPEQFKYKIRSVWFIDPQTGWALTIDGNILNTTDGGATWARQRKAGKITRKQKGFPDAQEPEPIDNIYFLDSKRGWAWGGGRQDETNDQPGTFLITADGGQHWNEVPYPFDQTASCIFFLNGQYAWASSEAGSFYKSTDGGLNWAKLPTKPPGEVLYRAIFFIDENTGWVVGRGGRMTKTTDGGKTWEKLYKVKDEFRMRDVFFFDRNRGWAIGEEGAILYTPDGGESWLNVGAPFPARLMDIVFVNDHTGWAVGLGGVVLKYEPK